MIHTENKTYVINTRDKTYSTVYTWDKTCNVMHTGDQTYHICILEIKLAMSCIPEIKLTIYAYWRQNLPMSFIPETELTVQFIWETNLTTAASMTKWLRPLILSTLNHSASHCCGFEPSSGHLRQANFCLRVVSCFTRDLPFSSHLMID